jgi:hypothetical protein
MGSGQGVSVLGNLAYVIASQGPEDDHPTANLQIVDVSNPARPMPLGMCQVSEDARAVQVTGRYAFVAGGTWNEDAPGWRDGLAVIDVSDRANPVRVTGLDTPGWAHDVHVAGDRVYLADGPGGLVIVSLPAGPLAIVEAPRSQSILYDGTATLSVSAVGSAALNYQWYMGESGDTAHPVVGATLASYTTPALRQSTAYWVRVSSGGYSVDSPTTPVAVAPIVVWGAVDWDRANLPAGLSNLVAVAAGWQHALALKGDGTAIAWGTYYDPASDKTVPATVPAGLSGVVAVTTGGGHDLALKSNGTVVAWGQNDLDQTVVPAGLSNVVGVAGGGYHSLALRADGTMAAWGRFYDGHSWVPFPLPSGLTQVVAVAAGAYQSLALRTDGTVTGWGYYYNGSSNVAMTVPAGLTNVVAVAGGGNHSLALRADGTVVAWGYYYNGNSYVAMSAPAGQTNVVAIAAGSSHSLALRSDGTVIGWGFNGSGQTTVPVGLSNVVAVAASQSYSLALLGKASPAVRPPLANPLRRDTTFSVSLPTASGRVYALEFKDALLDGPWTALPLVPGTGRDRTLVDAAATAPQRFYRVRQW